jgi:hypothetical protein
MVMNDGIVLTVRSLLVGVAGLVASALAFTAVYGQGPPTLTAEDRLEIQELLHRYMFVLDSCPDHDNGYAYADLYVEDGRFLSLQGREALARAISGGTAEVPCSPIRQRGPMNQIHLNVAAIIEPSPDGARGISYLLMIDGPGNEIYWNGWYLDEYVKTGRGWRFKARNHVGGGRVGVPADLSAARFLWERQPTPKGSRHLLGQSEPRGSGVIARDPLRWLTGDEPSLPPVGN